MVSRVGKSRPVLRFLAFFAAFSLVGLLLFLPFPKRVGANGNYEVEWENGARTSETYASVSACLEDCTEEELLLGREGVSGRMAVSAEYSKRFALLAGGSLAELLAASYPALSPSESLALWRKFAQVGYYSEEFFAYGGSGFSRTERTHFSEVVLMTGNISASVLQRSGAEKLTLRAEAQLKGSALFGTRIKEFGAFAPYYAKEDALFLSTPGGTRLVAALPLAEELCITVDIHFCDEGALSSCMALKTLTLPFVGSSVSPDGSDYDGRLQYMFGENVPESLKRVKVTGGALKTFAFEGCRAIEEIDLCGIAWTAISRDAFVGCYGLEKLHTSLKNPNIEGNFKVTSLPCGCFLYEREVL